MLKPQIGLVRSRPLELRPTNVTRIALVPVFGLLALMFGAIAIPLAVPCIAGCVGSFVCVIARRRLIVDDTGVEIRGTFGRRRMVWDEIDHYTYWVTTAATGLVESASERLLGSRTSGVNRPRLVHYTTSGRRLTIDLFYRG